MSGVGMRTFIIAVLASLILHVPHSFASTSAHGLYIKAQNESFMFKKIALYNQAIEMDAHFTDARKARASILYYQGKYRLAERDLNYCITAGNADKDIYVLRGRVRMALKNYKGAERDFSSALKLDPADRFVRIERAKARYMNKNYEGALKDVQDIIRSGIEDDLMDQAYKIAGFILLDNGRHKMAEENFRMASVSNDFAYGGFYSRFYDPRKISLLGMVGLIVGILVLLFRIELPPPRKRR